MTPREQALNNVGEARRWVAQAIAGLNRIIRFPGARSDIENLAEFKAVKTHFHLSLGPAPSVFKRFLQILPFLDDLGDPTLEALKDIRFKYFDIGTALVSGGQNGATLAEPGGAIPPRLDGGAPGTTVSVAGTGKRIIGKAPRRATRETLCAVLPLVRLRLYPEDFAVAESAPLCRCTVQVTFIRQQVAHRTRPI